MTPDPQESEADEPDLRTTVLVVEDEESFAEALSIGLQREGFRVELAGDGVAALERFSETAPDIVLLDIMLPKLSGLDVCREIRTTSDVPIIMVSAKGEELDAVVGLEMGADDYVVKPYRLRELVARMRSVLRRFQAKAGASDGADGDPGDAAIVVGDVTVDPDSHELRVRGEKLSIPLREFELLHLLAENAGRVLTREVLINRVWGLDYVGDTKTLDVHIKRIRAKIEDDPSKPEKIVTIRGLGYKYEKA